MAKPINESHTLAPAHLQQFEMEYVIRFAKQIELRLVHCRPIRNNNTGLDHYVAEPAARVFPGQATLRGPITGGRFR